MRDLNKYFVHSRFDSKFMFLYLFYELFPLRRAKCYNGKDKKF